MNEAFAAPEEIRLGQHVTRAHKSKAVKSSRVAKKVLLTGSDHQYQDSRTTGMPRHVRMLVVAWGLGVASLAGLLSISSYRSQWQEQLPLQHFKNGAAVPKAPFSAALYVSFVSVHFETAHVVSEVEAALTAGRERPIPITLKQVGPQDYSATVDPPVPSPVTDPLQLKISAPDVAGSVTVGHSGQKPAANPLVHWWTTLAVFWLLGTAVLLIPDTWPHQRSMLNRAMAVAGLPGAVILIACGSMAIRAILVLRGGQYFDLDEGRYAMAAGIFELLADGRVNAAVETIVNAADHPGFRIVALVPAFFHTITASLNGVSVAETRHAAGEWLPALILSLASVGSIVLTYGLATRLGASQREGVLASLLMAASGTMLMYARHLVPYDVALALMLFSLSIGLKKDGHVFRSYVSGVVAGLSFLTYAGYWLSVPAIGLLLLLGQASNRASLARMAMLFGAGVLSVPAIVLAAGFLTDVDVLARFRGFAGTVTHGDFSEGWSLPWAALWHADGALIIVYGIGIAWAIQDGRRGAYWLAGAVFIYAGLVIGSNLLHRFVVYDRLSRQLVPLICLAAAAGLGTFKEGRWLRGLRGVALFGVVTALGVINAWPHVTQRFPREFVRDVVREYGTANLSLGTTLKEVDMVSASSFVPVQGNRTAYDPRNPTHYVLFNATDLWVDRRIERLMAPPLGRVLRQEVHPRQRPIWQYHGYTRRQREFMRAIDASVRLIEVCERCYEVRTNASR